MDGTLYLWVKALHLISVIFWMAGMFMLPRYFAYHAEADIGSDEDRKWQERERKLLRIIINPAMIATWVFGISLAMSYGFSEIWLHVKLLFVVGLTLLHHGLSRWRKAFARGENSHSSKFYRLVNEIPTLSTIVIVILVIVKPF
ncbi:membrane protein [Iodidimonas muriae]|uniref:Protoporphyrinogen IX oxidase n=1 Tax=Iodidimonas muriae TaxID=261467 RepID=A0ABQ2L9H6_9PROT|nr:protoporphyrinogen oxidase HemJ [Iodidimonas muriae]GER05960.1 membrane protein [Kordiimonadales bacterium JCM 17843]GGO07595.1 membrane protein [Iodidimonas muriae]